MNTINMKYRFSKINIAALLCLIGIMQTVFAADFPPAGDPARGSKVWAENCTRCHNMRSPADLSDEQWITSVFHMRIRAGLTGQETRDIITFLQSANGQAQSQTLQPQANLELAKNQAIEEVNDGAIVYSTNCVACHGADGKGVLPGVPDFTKTSGPLSKTNQVLLTNIINGYQSPGNPLPMPARGGNSQLSDADLAVVLEYIKNSFKH